MELYIPKVKVRSHQYPKWFTAHLRHQVKCLRTLRRKIKNHFTLSQLDRLIDAENNFSQQLFRAKRDYEHYLINKYACSRDPSIYRYIHSLTNSGSLPFVLHNDSTEVTTDMDKANRGVRHLWKSRTLAQKSREITTEIIGNQEIRLHVRNHNLSPNSF